MSEAGCNGRASTYALAALRGEVERVRAAQEGERNDTLNRAAFSLGQLVADGQLDADEVADELTEAAEEAGLMARETRATIRSGLRGGARNPRAPLSGAGPALGSVAAPMTPEGDWAARLARLGGETVSPLERLRGAVVTTKDLDDMAEPEPLVGKVLYRDSLAWLFGAPGSYKSFIALDIAGSVGTGEPWQAEGRTTQGAVLYVVAEGVSGLRVRVRAWEAASGRAMEGVAFLPMAVQASNASVWDALIALAVEYHAVLIVLDTQARMSTGLEENSATEMGRFVERLEELRAATGACVLTIHHTGRGGDHLRGSIALDGAATTIIKVTRTEDQVEIECVKQKDAAEFDPIRLRAIERDGSIVMSGSVGPTKINFASPGLLKCVDEWWGVYESDWVTPKAIQEVTGTPRQTFARYAKALVDGGMAEAKGEGSARRIRLTRAPNRLTDSSMPTTDSRSREPPNWN